MNISIRLAIGFCLLNNSILNYAMELTPSRPRLQVGHLETFKDIIHAHRTIGNIAPAIKRLADENQSWKTILSDRNCCGNLYFILQDHELPSREVIAMFFGTPGYIEYAKEFIQENPEAQTRLESLLVDTGSWIHREPHWPTQATDIAHAIIQTTHNPDAIAEGRTALLNAAKTNNLDIMKLLINAGASINLKDERLTTTPLIEATKNGHSAAVQLLLKAGAEIGLTDGSNKTAIHHIEEILEASESSYGIISSLLIAYAFKQ